MQEAGILALADEEHAEHMRRIYRQKRDLLLPALKDIGLEVRESPATFYIWQKVNGSDIEFAQYLLEPDIGIVVTPGSSLSDECEGGINPGYRYVRIALIPTMEEIEEAVIKLKKLKL